MVFRQGVVLLLVFMCVLLVLVFMCLVLVLIFMCLVLVLVLMCMLVIVVLVLMCLFLGCRLVSVVCLVVALLEELATQSVLPFGLNVQWGVWGGLMIMQGGI
jgi:hypothetical protein